MKTRKATTSITPVEMHRLDCLCKKLGVTRTALLRELILIVTGASELRSPTKTALQAMLQRSDTK